MGGRVSGSARARYLAASTGIREQIPKPRSFGDILEDNRISHATRVLSDLGANLVRAKRPSEVLTALYRGFPSLTAITVYLAKKDKLIHYFTIKGESDVGQLREQQILTAGSPEMAAYERFMALVLHSPREIMLAFNLVPNDFSFQVERIKQKGEGIRCILPLYIEEETSGGARKLGIISFDGSDTLLSNANIPGKISREVLAVVATITRIVSNVINNEFDTVTSLRRQMAFDIATKEAILAYRNDAKYDANVLMLDLDHFKNVNDRYGHLNGNIVLAEVAEAIIESVRTKSKAKRARQLDQVFRWGGEEFAIVLPGNLEAAKIVAGRIRRNVEAKGIKIPGTRKALKITCSIGIANIGVVLGGRKITNVTDAEREIQRQADAALYEAKHRGRNRAVYVGRSGASLQYKLVA